MYLGAIIKRSSCVISIFFSPLKFAEGEKRKRSFFWLGRDEEAKVTAQTAKINALANDGCGGVRE